MWAAVKTCVSAHKIGLAILLSRSCYRAARTNRSRVRTRAIMYFLLLALTWLESGRNHRKTISLAMPIFLRDLLSRYHTRAYFNPHFCLSVSPRTQFVTRACAFLAETLSREWARFSISGNGIKFVALRSLSPLFPLLSPALLRSLKERLESFENSHHRRWITWRSFRNCLR